MTIAEFNTSLHHDAPPSGLTLPLRALWWDAKGAWEEAHAVVAPDEDGRAAAWVHAYLHRKGGDAANARYWYGRARRPVSNRPLEEECGAIVAALLAREGPAG